MEGDWVEGDFSRYPSVTENGYHSKLGVLDGIGTRVTAVKGPRARGLTRGLTLRAKAVLGRSRRV